MLSSFNEPVKPQGKILLPESGLNTIATHGDFFGKVRTLSNDHVFSSPKGLAFLTDDPINYDIDDNDEELEMHIDSTEIGFKEPVKLNEGKFNLSP